jgi:hypothetical protein
VVLLALAGEDHWRGAPRLGYPAHSPVAFRQHTCARQYPAVGHDAFDRQDGPPLGAVVEHLLGDDSTREVAERLQHDAFAGLLSPSDQAVGLKVWPGRDRRVGCCGCRPTLDHPEARAPQLALEIAHANAGLFQLVENALVAGWVVLPDRGDRGQRLGLERRARIGIRPGDDLAQGGFDTVPFPFAMSVEGGRPGFIG